MYIVGTTSTAYVPLDSASSVSSNSFTVTFVDNGEPLILFRI